MSYLTPEEIDALQSSKLTRETPYVMRDVTHGMFSVARYYGGANYNGASYTYMAPTDELVRDDVVKWIKKRRKAAIARLNASAPQLLASLKRMQVALGAFCCDNCITEDDLEDSGSDLLDASREADALIAEVEGKL